MAFWLMKSEPATFSIEDLKRVNVGGWDGVRNYSARNFLRQMRPGEKALFYHSSVTPAAIVGLMEIVKAAYPDPTQFDRKSDHYDPGSKADAPRWSQVDVKFERIFKRPLTLGEIKEMPALKEMLLLKRGRLSVQPVTPAEFEAILKAAA
jgi:predicted RNA-binding protein with PUA-like domain